MKLALIGYGKMGQHVERIALERGHEIKVKIDQDNRAQMPELLKGCDVAIEFTQPDSAVANLKASCEAGLPVVTGTTGWYDSFQEVTDAFEAAQGALFYATNFSIGVNLFFEVNRTLARLMNTQPEYEVYAEEIHHTQKKDAPSGTALTLVEDMLARLDRKNTWRLYESEDSEEISITSKRILDTPGTHSIRYESLIDRIEITHEAKNRQGFALGAVVAAEWLRGKTGVFTMRDMLHTA